MVSKEGFSKNERDVYIFATHISVRREIIRVSLVLHSTHNNKSRTFRRSSPLLSKGRAGCDDSKGQVTFDSDAIQGRAANADLMDFLRHHRRRRSDRYGTLGVRDDGSHNCYA